MPHVERGVQRTRRVRARRSQRHAAAGQVVVDEIAQRAVDPHRRHWPSLLVQRGRGGAAGGGDLLVPADIRRGGRRPAADRDLRYPAARAVVAVDRRARRTAGLVLPGDQPLQGIVAQHLPGGSA